MTDRIRVTWLCLEWPTRSEHVGGVGRYSFRLAESLSNLVELTVVTRQDPVPLAGVEMVELELKPSRVHRYYVAPWKVRSLVADTAPDLVHSHGDDWLLRSGKPVVRSFYGSAWGEARSSTGLRQLNHLVLAVTEWVSMRRADLRIGIAAESEDAFNCQVVMPPVVLRHPVPVREPARLPTAVFLGSHQGRKQGWLAEQAVMSHRERTGLDSRLLVIGPETDKGSWAPWVTHLSGLDDNDVAGALATAWVLLSPSSYEGFGIPLIEGLHAGLPVVAMRNPGSEWLRAQAPPLVPLRVVPDDVSFVAVVQELLESAAPLEQPVIDASRRFVDEIEFDASAERLLELYRRVSP